MKSFSGIDSFVAGNRDEMAIFFEKLNKEGMINLKNPVVKDVTIEGDERAVHRDIINGGSVVPFSGRKLTATITVETMEWESLWGQDIRRELPDVNPDEMSVQKLLAVVNKKLDE